MAESITTVDVKPRKRTNSWWWTRADVDLSQLPATVDLSVGPILKRAAMGILVLIIMTVSGIWGQSGLIHDWGTVLGKLLLLCFVFSAAYVAVLRLLALWKRQRVTFDLSTVSVERMGFFGRRAWSLPYTEFEGVLCREAQVPVFVGSAHLQIIELYHRDPDKTVPLYVQELAEVPRERWQAYAERLKLSALVDSGDEAKPGNMEEILQAIRDIVRDENGRPRTFNASTPPKG